MSNIGIAEMEVLQRIGPRGLTAFEIKLGIFSKRLLALCSNFKEGFELGSVMTKV